MNKIFYISLLFVSLFQTINTWAQDKDIPFDKKIFTDDKEGFDEAVRQIKLGESLFYDGQDEYIAHANMHFLKAQAFNPYSAVLNYKIGVCYLYGTEKAKSLEHFQFVQKVSPDLEKELPFYLAQAYQLNNEFDSAIVYYQEYKKIVSNDDVEQHAYISKKIRESRTGIELTKNPVLVWIDNLGDSINSEYPEYSPVISADNKGLFYTARRPDTKGGKTDRIGVYYEDIYYAERASESDWSAGKNIGSPVNTSSHDATVGLSPDGNSILTYQGVGSNDGNIALTRQNADGTWIKPEALGEHINSKYHESSATLSFDEKTLIFVSDKPGGYGRHDIYISKWNEVDSAWGEPQNIGSKINTRYEEKGVFLMADSRTLYFSSDGHNNMGGLDIFKTVLDPETNEWSTPENLGYPINTPDDDIYFVVTGNGRYAYYSSHREGGFGEKDIYKITFLGDKKVPATINPLNNLSAIPSSGTYQLVGINKTNNPSATDNVPRANLADISGTVKNAETKKGIPAKITARNANGSEVLYFFESNAKGGYTANLSGASSYELTASALGYEPQTRRVTLTDKNINKFNFELVPVKVVSGGEVIPNDPDDDKPYYISDPDPNDVVNKDPKVGNGDDKENNEPITEVPSNYTVVIDGLVRDANTKLPMSANVVISDNSTNAQVSNELANKIGVFATSLSNKNAYDITVSKSGYKTMTKTVTKGLKRSDLIFDLVPLKAGDPVVQDNSNQTIKKEITKAFDIEEIYFGFDESSVNHTAFGSNGKRELESLAQHMKNNPDLKVRLTGHTDQRGSSEYNMTLSKKRAENAKKYLMSLDISSSRIVTVGKGEDMPKIGLTEIRSLTSIREKEVAYQRNRRTEIVLFQ
jgi:outer membrane protein OmpA-like peptidoglycan-associated protein